MKKVLVFGAGMVAGAHVRYLLDQPDFHVTVASRTLSKAQELVKGHPAGAAAAVNSDDEAALEALIRQADLAVSLLPYAYHPVVARLCIKHRVHMVTTSYVKQAMADLDAGRQSGGGDPAQRDRRGSGHRPHDGHAGDPQSAARGRQDRQLRVVVRRSARARGQHQPVRLQILLEPPRGAACGQEPGALPVGRPGGDHPRRRAVRPLLDGAGGGGGTADRLRGLPQPRQPALRDDLRHRGRPHDVPRHPAQRRLVPHAAQDRRPGPAGRSAACRSGRRHLGRPHAEADRLPRRTDGPTWPRS